MFHASVSDKLQGYIDFPKDELMEVMHGPVISMSAEW